MDRHLQHTSMIHCASADTFLGALKRLYEHYERPEVIASETARAVAQSNRFDLNNCRIHLILLVHELIR